ncbi:SDR family NAD(P)-dependent oxidoreductase [Pseudonocardia sp. MH-G8]|uniref:SDR family NAD(P)-dependent oxidoreductase n=1 Tax=Pseudonocardia sp. MH-G8 TaxID=1854588 RepID=UPI000BA12649|nr:SDR family NAD(P)-dependent oxidoreductase [Pseudonocardia sp. MH-G8]OZM80829.1 short-chain dehydrogenase [Pseudonocardia sp. MH-G8]
MSGRFLGKAAVVTGASGDLGRLLCEALLDEGCSVVGIDVDAAGGELMQAQAREAGRDLTFRQVDVAEADAVAAFGRDSGPVDIVVNAAGVISYARIGETTAEEWDRVMGVNVRGAFLVTKALEPVLRDGGSVINIASSAALRAGAGWSAYSVSKAGLVAFTKVAAAELAPRARVNVVCPGALDTRMPHRLLDGHPAKDAVLEQMAQASMLGRLGEAREVVPLCLFLAGAEAGLVTGATIAVDGGMTAW